MLITLATETIVYGGDVIAATVTFKNNALTSVIAKMRLDMRVSGFAATWIEGLWKTAPAVAGLGTGTVILEAVPIPTDWGVGATIDLKIQIEGKQGPGWQLDNGFIIGNKLDVTLLTVTPYVKGRTA